jgi:hypothetical protein
MRDVDELQRMIIEKTLEDKTRFDRNGNPLKYCAGYEGAFEVFDIVIDRKSKIFKCKIGRQFAA